MQPQSQLKRFKIENLEFEREVPLFHDSWHAVDSTPENFANIREISMHEIE